MRSYDKLLIGGAWTAPATTDTIEVVSPHTEQVIATVPAAARADVDDAVAAARTAVDTSGWSRTTPADRLAVLERFITEYEAHCDELAVTATEEMGAPIAQVRASSTVPVATARRFADYARALNWTDHRTGLFGQPIEVTRSPVGVVAAVVPWNAPQFLTMIKLAPALAAGCSIVVKPAPETPVDGLMLGEIARAAGIPDGVLSVLPAGREVSEYLVGHPGVDKVSFTGSSAAGRTIAAICGQNLTSVSLELGGKSAAIVLEDADTDSVVRGVLQSVLMNNGQVCTCNSRMVVVRSRYDEVVDALAACFQGLVIGDPMDESTAIGPLVAARQRDRVQKYIALGQEQGARMVVGGAGAPAGHDRGWYVRPTLFADVDPSARIAQEEIFGPVLAVSVAADEDEAIAIANNSEYGLAGGVWTADDRRARDVAARVHTGNYGINQAYGPDATSPFGGRKASGLGSEMGLEGLDEYLRFQTVMGRASA